MRLAAKYTALLMLGIAVVLSVNGHFRVERELGFYKDEITRHERVLGRTIRNMAGHVLSSEGEEAFLREIARIGEIKRGVSIRWIWVDAPEGSPYAAGVPGDKLAPVVDGDTVTLKKDNGENQDSLSTYVPVDLPSGRKGAIEIEIGFERIERYVSESARRTIVSALTILLISIIIVFWSGIWMIGRPLRKLVRKTRRVGAGDMSEPVLLRGRDELTELANAVNAMCEDIERSHRELELATAARIDAVEQLRHSERLNTVGRLASGLAHELGTSLNVVSGRAALLMGDTISPEQVKENAFIIREQTRRMTATIQQGLDFARQRTLNKMVVDLRGAITEVIHLLEPLARNHQAKLIFTMPDTALLACVDRGQLFQVLSNLVVNAVQAMNSGGNVQVSLDETAAIRPNIAEPQQVERYARIDVCDEGSGIAKEDMAHIFEPFFTTKEVGKGTGLGLSIAHGIVKEHEGWIEVSSEHGKWTRFSVYLPLHQ